MEQLLLLLLLLSLLLLPFMSGATEHQGVDVAAVRPLPPTSQQQAQPRQEACRCRSKQTRKLLHVHTHRHERTHSHRCFPSDLHAHAKVVRALLVTWRKWEKLRAVVLVTVMSHNNIQI